MCEECLVAFGSCHKRLCGCVAIQTTDSLESGTSVLLPRPGVAVAALAVLGNAGLSDKKKGKKSNSAKQKEKVSLRCGRGG